MRSILGLVVLHALFVVTGLSLLRLLGLTPRRLTPRAVGCVVGPAVAVGMCVVIPLQLVLLVIGVPLTPVGTILLGGACALGFIGLARRRSAASPAWLANREARSGSRWPQRLGAAIALLYLAVGGWAMARLPTVLDDARIWSLKGLTLTYYHVLQPEIFQNQGQAGAHPVYPLFQPALEGVLFQAMGSAQLRLFHAELWLLAGCALWTAAYLIRGRTRGDGIGSWLWLIALILIALTPAVVTNLSMGYADVTGAVLLGVGALSLALWLDCDHPGYLGLAAVLLAAAANVKDEDLLAAFLVVASGALAVMLNLRGRSVRQWSRDRVYPLIAAASLIAILVLPWRVWTLAHRLTEGVEPSLPHALSPAFILSRGHEFGEAATAMLAQTLNEFGWLAAVFLVACTICLITGVARRTAGFYLIAVVLVVGSLLWLYTTTSQPLSFLIPTSMNRTVDVFMLLAACATAHLVASLAGVLQPRSPPP